MLYKLIRYIYKVEHCSISWNKENTLGGDLFGTGKPTDELIPAPLIEHHYFSIEIGKGGFYLNILDFLDRKITSKSGEAFKSQVIHTPTNCNFWHCSIKWIIGGEGSANLSKSRRRKFLSAARTEIINKAIVEEPTFKL